MGLNQIKFAARISPRSGRWLTRLKTLISKMRRLILCVTARQYVRNQEGQRLGECYQCGRCCRLVFKCPFLAGPDENPRCMIYDRRPRPCVAFPIDERDLADVSYLCGYSFERKTGPDRVIPGFF